MRRLAFQGLRRRFAAVAVGNSALCCSERIALEVQTFNALAGGGANDAGLKALAILFQTVALLAIAALQMPTCVLELLLASWGRRYLWLEGKRVALEGGFDGCLAL